MKKENYADTRSSFKNFLLGVIGSAYLNPICRASYPFPFMEKTLTYDWENVGSDINSSLKKIKTDA